MLDKNEVGVKSLAIVFSNLRFCSLFVRMLEKSRTKRSDLLSGLKRKHNIEVHKKMSKENIDFCLSSNSAVNLKRQLTSRTKFFLCESFRIELKLFLINFIMHFTDKSDISKFQAVF